MNNFFIAEIGGKQLWLEPNKYYDINRIKVDEGKDIWLRRILLVGVNKTRYIGQPYIKNVAVLVQVIRHLRGPKIIVYKMKRKKKYRRTQGHRQELTRIMIKKIYLD